MWSITRSARDALFAHALRERPNEACGLVSAAVAGGVITGFHPVTNAAAAPDRFELDGEEFLAAESAIDDAGEVWVGVMHSHVATSAYPSPTDRDASSRFDPDGTLVHLIVSLAGATPVVRAYHLGQGAVTEQRLVLAEPDDELDEPGASAVALRRPRPTPEPG